MAAKINGGDLMDSCRNCGAVTLRELGFTGNLAPFFLKRVYRAKLVTRVSSHPLKRLIQKLTTFVQPLASRIQPVDVAVEMQSCLNCSFVQSKFSFPEEGISRLYSDYRSDSYNKERCFYEPSYTALANQVGQHTENGQDRISALTTWLESRVSLSGISMLDYGGANGQFLPAIQGDKYVFEISDIEPFSGVTRISDASLLQNYTYIQLSHVLEHVNEPLNMVKQVASYLAKDGYLLVEVPQDHSTEFLKHLQTDSVTDNVGVHEHINNYCELSVQKLIESAGLQLISIEAVPVESPIAKQKFIRALAKSR
ncbi:MAG: class I SAM-dependent methyltransferase [Edaphobacter sp.]